MSGIDVMRFKPHTYGHHFEFWVNALGTAGEIAFCGPSASHNGKHKHVAQALSKTVTVVMGANNSTIEVKDGVAWTFGAVPVHPKRAAKALAFKAVIEAAVTALP